MESAAFDESQDRAEIGNILGISGGQFHVAISSRLAPVCLARIDALSERLEFHGDGFAWLCSIWLR